MILGGNVKVKIKKMYIYLFLLNFMAITFLGCSNSTSKVIAFIPKGDSTYWTMVKENINKTASENGFQVESKATDSESDYKKQKEIMQEMIKDKVSAILLAPCSVTELIPDIKEANKKGIPVVLIDTDVDKELLEIENAEVETFVGTDNYAGGKLIGERAVKKTDGKGNVAILNGIIGQIGGEARCKGFEDTVKSAGMNVVASVATNWSKDDGYNKAKTLLLAYPDLKIIFAANDDIAQGVLEAMKELNRNILIETFDTSDETIADINKREIDATVNQHPEIMAKNSVEAVKTILNGNKVDSSIYTNLELITEK